MKVITHEDFKAMYTEEPAAFPGRIESVLEALAGEATFEEAYPAAWEDIAAVHTKAHIETVERMRLYNIASLAAGGAVQAAVEGMTEPCFALVRPPGHHASADSSWGFCYFNNMAVALDHLHRNGLIKSAFVLDFDMHYGDGTVSILKPRGYAKILNPYEEDRRLYMEEVSNALATVEADVIGVSAGFDNHILDWGALLLTEDYQAMGRMVFERCARIGAGCFAVLEGGYNHDVLGQNVRAFLRGLQGL